MWIKRTIFTESAHSCCDLFNPHVLHLADVNTEEVEVQHKYCRHKYKDYNTLDAQQPLKVESGWSWSVMAVFVWLCCVKGAASSEVSDGPPTLPHPPGAYLSHLSLGGRSWMCLCTNQSFNITNPRKQTNRCYSATSAKKQAAHHLIMNQNTMMITYVYLHGAEAPRLAG